jgi:phosphatidylglycerophosphate synthase
MTKYVYPPLVWRLVRPLARWRVHPNWVTGLDVVLALAAIPLFAAGHWVAGLAFGYTMSVLDSVDGKLARLTYRTSGVGDVLDIGLDIVHPPLWYLAWAWSLSGGRTGSAVFHLALWMLALYGRSTGDAVLQAHDGRSIRLCADRRAGRTFISRRNVNLPVFTAGLLVGAPVAAFEAIVVWQAVTLVFHAVRLIRPAPAARPTPAACRRARPAGRATPARVRARQPTRSLAALCCLLLAGVAGPWACRASPCSSWPFPPATTARRAPPGARASRRRCRARCCGSASSPASSCCSA